MSWVQVWGFANSVSDASGKRLRISGPVSYPGFMFTISTAWNRRTFAGILGFRSLLRVFLSRVTFRLGFYVRGSCFLLYWSF